MKYKIDKVTVELIKELDYEKIEKGYNIYIFRENRWLVIEKDSNDLNSRFLQMIVEKWKKENNRNYLLNEDLNYIEIIRENISNHLGTQFLNSIGKMMEKEFETKYSNNMYFETKWKEKKY